MFEDFALSTNIAGDCGHIITTPTDGECAYTYADEFKGDVSVFVAEVSACTTKDADGVYNGLCYNVPTDYSNLFNS